MLSSASSAYTSRETASRECMSPDPTRMYSTIFRPLCSSAVGVSAIVSPSRRICGTGYAIEESLNATRNVSVPGTVSNVTV